MATTERRKQPRTLPAQIERAIRAAEDKKVSAALEKMGVDWSMGPATGAAPQLQMTLQPVGQPAGADAKLVFTFLPPERGALPPAATEPVLAE